VTSYNKDVNLKNILWKSFPKILATSPEQIYKVLNNYIFILFYCLGTGGPRMWITLSKWLGGQRPNSQEAAAQLRKKKNLTPSVMMDTNFLMTDINQMMYAFIRFIAWLQDFLPWAHQANLAEVSDMICSDPKAYCRSWSSQVEDTNVP
jgi:hypothetical protein